MKTPGIVPLLVFLLSGCGSGDDGHGVECVYGAGFVAQFDKSCQTASDCARVSAGLDCCGTSLYAGVEKSEESRFQSAWSDCLQQLQACDCLARQPQAEDGNQTTNTDNIQLDCQAGSCTTFIN